MRDAPVTALDPRWFTPDLMDAEAAAFNAAMEAQAASASPQPRPRPEHLPAVRAGIAEGLRGGPASPAAEDRTVPGPAGAVPLRVFVPAAVRGVYLSLHGGGFVLGRADMHDARCADLARRCAVVVVSVDYRQAPEHPYPAAPDDCEAVALWLAEHARGEFGADCLLIGGSSAGANLAVVTLLRLRDRHRFSGVAAANLLFGWYDLSLTPSVRQWGERPLFQTRSDLEWCRAQYAPAALYQDPDISPLYADLRHLPPALFTVGTEDCVLDDTLFMYSRWVAAGNAAELAVYPGGCHEFTSFPLALGRRANARMDAFLAAAVGRTSATSAPP